MTNSILRSSYPYARIAERYSLPYWVVVTLAEGARDEVYGGGPHNAAAIAYVAEHMPYEPAQISLFQDLTDAHAANPYLAPRPPAP